MDNIQNNNREQLLQSIDDLIRSNELLRISFNSLSLHIQSFSSSNHFGKKEMQLASNRIGGDILAIESDIKELKLMIINMIN